MGLFKRKVSKKESLNKTKREWSGWGAIDAFNLYTRIIADKWTRGRMDNPSDKLEGRSLGGSQFYYSVNRIFTRKGVKKPYFISLPKEIERGFVTDLREDITRAVDSYNQRNQTDEHVSVTVIVDAQKFLVNLGDKRMQGRFKLWAKQYNRLMRESENKGLEDVLNSDKHTEDTKHKVGSYLYMKEATEQHKASFFKSTFILELNATSDEILDEIDNVMKAKFFQLEIQTKEVFIQTNEYMKSYAPTATETKSLIRQMHEGGVFADDTLSSLSMPSHGVIGDNKGDFHGVDVLSQRAVTFDMFSGTDVKNILLTAMSGQGKSNYAKMLYTFYTSKKHYGTVVFDYEGTEYTPIGNITGADIISMSDSSGRYVNTMVIGDLTGDPDIDVNLRTDAQSSTVQIFNLLVDENDGMTEVQESILSEALNETYLDFGVTLEQESWVNSKGITFFHVYLKLKDFINKSNFQDKRELHGEGNIKQMVSILSKFFEEGGINKHWFKDPISIQELLDKKNVIFSFGMGKKSEVMADGKDVALRQMFASHITTLLANHNIKNNVKTVIFVEEVQRYLKQRFSGEILAKFTSGGRKNGMITYLITNSPSELIGMHESFFNDELRENANTILGNISMHIIGSLLKRSMDDLIDTFGLEDARGVLYQLSEIAEGKTANSGLKYCFYVRHEGQSGLVRMLVHPALEGLPIYETKNPSKDQDNKLRTVEHANHNKIVDGIIEAEKVDKANKSKDFNEFMDSNSNNGTIWRKSNILDANK